MLIFVALAAIVHIVFAFAVATDGNRLRSFGVGTFFVGPGMWAFATLMGGVYVAVAYWLIHHSSLRPSLPPWEARADKHISESGLHGE